MNEYEFLQTMPAAFFLPYPKPDCIANGSVNVNLISSSDVKNAMLHMEHWPMLTPEWMRIVYELLQV